MQLSDEGFPHFLGTVHPTLTQPALLQLRLLRRKHGLLLGPHCHQDLLLLEALHLVPRQGLFHPADGVFHASQLVDLLGDHVRVLVEVFLGVGVWASGLLEEDQLRLEIAIVLVVDDGSLKGELDIVHKWFAVRSEVLVRVGLRELLLCQLRLLLPVLFPSLAGIVQDLDI